MKPFTQKQVATILGVQQPTISKYFNGVLEISAKDALKLNKVLKIPFDVWEDPKTYLQNNNIQSEKIMK